MKLNYGQVALFITLLVGVTEASNSVPRYDKTLIVTDYGARSDYFINGLADRPNDQIHHIIKTDMFVNHIRNLAIQQQPLEFKNDQQYGMFLQEFEGHLAKLEELYAELVAKRAQKQQESASTWSFFSTSKKNDLNQAIAAMDAEIVALEKKILKMKSFQDFCHNKGCKKFSVPENKGFGGEIKSLFNTFNPFNNRAKLSKVHPTKQ